MRPTFQPNRLIQCGNLTHCRINISAHGYSSVHINGIQSKIYIFFAPCFHVSLYNSFYSSTPDRGPLGLRSKLPASEFMVHLLFFSALSDLTLFSVKGGRESSWMWNGVTFLRAGKTPQSISPHHADYFLHFLKSVHLLHVECYQECFR